MSNPTSRYEPYRIVNRILNWYERKTGRTFGPGHVGYGAYYRLFVRGR